MSIERDLKGERDAAIVSGEITLEMLVDLMHERLDRTFRMACMANITPINEQGIKLLRDGVEDIALSIRSFEDIPGVREGKNPNFHTMP